MPADAQLGGGAVRLWELRKAVYVIDRVRADTDDVKHQEAPGKVEKLNKWKSGKVSKKCKVG